MISNGFYTISNDDRLEAISTCSWMQDAASTIGTVWFFVHPH